MATITLNASAYNEAIRCAKRHNLSVDDYVVSLIYKSSNAQREDSVFLKSVDELSPVLKEVLSIPLQGKMNPEDVNGNEAREEYYKEKYGI